jgi:hypothetical protein
VLPCDPLAEEHLRDQRRSAQWFFRWDMLGLVALRAMVAGKAGAL